MSAPAAREELAGTGWSRTAVQLLPEYTKIQLPKFPEAKVSGLSPHFSPDIGPNLLPLPAALCNTLATPIQGKGAGFARDLPTVSWGSEAGAGEGSKQQNHLQGGAVLGSRTIPW